MACHGRVEEAHYGGTELGCAACHGGDPTSVTKEGGHPTVSISFNPSSPGGAAEGGAILSDPTLTALDSLDPEVIKFLNPSDYRVAKETCGSTTLGGGNCHTRITQGSILSTHATLSGQLAGGLYFGGLTDRDAVFAVGDIEDIYYTSSLPGTIASLERFPSEESIISAEDPVAASYFATFGQLCLECHLGRDGEPVPGKYYSSGCNACHLLTSNQSRAGTADETQDLEELGHPTGHRLTNLIPDEQCNHCHHAHLHRGLLIQGVREKSEPEGDEPIGGVNRGAEDPEDAVFWPEDNYVRYQGGHWLYGKPFPFYISDEDGTNDIDETPPDIHFEKGMACIDCHTMREMHGGEHMPIRREFEAQVRCESCHGAPGFEIDAHDVAFVTAKSRVGGSADNLLTVELQPSGNWEQIGKFDNAQHPVTQIDRRVDATGHDFNPRTLLGCGLHSGTVAFRQTLAEWVEATSPEERSKEFPGLPEGASLPADLGERPGRLECFTCHNSWTVNCYGCHMVRDDRGCGRSTLDGSCDPKISTFAMTVLPDALALGFNSRGLITPMVGTSIFYSHIDENGQPLIDAAPMQTIDGFAGHGNSHNPVHHHTIRKIPRDCQGCHPNAADPAADDAALKRAIGFGTGEFLFIDGIGVEHILDRLVLIDFDGDGAWEDPTSTPLTGPAVAVEPVASSTHVPLDDESAEVGPGMLDLESINRILENSVVPQREE